MEVIGNGKCNRFYRLILLSALLKILINILFKIEIPKYLSYESISIIQFPVLNFHIFARMIYYYFGLLFIGLIYVIKLIINKEFFVNEIIKEKYNRAIRSILLVIIFIL